MIDITLADYQQKDFRIAVPARMLKPFFDHPRLGSLAASLEWRLLGMSLKFTGKEVDKTVAGLVTSDIQIAFGEKISQKY